MVAVGFSVILLSIC